MKVLIVEDNESLPDLLARILEHLDYLPVLASHGKDGLQKAIAEKPDFILMDMLMPVTDGKRREPFAPIPRQRIVRFWQQPRCLVLLT
jgi:CheY-like chemotaxis protein